jgi:hypothetical protein
MVNHTHNMNHAHLKKVVYPMATGLGLVVLDNSVYRVERRL